MEVAKIKINGTNAEASELKTITSGMVGATVGIEYDNTWDGLNKQVVFKTAFKTVNADGTAVPPELLRISGVNLQVGVYGYTDDGTVAIPTVWASLGNIQPGADPEGDEAANPTLPVWARMQTQIDGVEESFNNLEESTNAALEAANKAASDAAEQAGSASGQAEAAAAAAAAASTEAAAANAAAESASAAATAASEKADAALEELDRLNGVLPAVTAEDAGKALVVSADGRIVADDGMTEQDVLAEQVLTFTWPGEEPENPYVIISGENFYHFQAGKTYFVVWDGAVHPCVAAKLDMDGEFIVYIGNLGVIELGDDTGEPFLLLDFYGMDDAGEEVLGMSGAYTNSPDLTLTEVSHTVRIYQRVKAEPYYTKAEIDAALGSYINDIDALIGGDA